MKLPNNHLGSGRWRIVHATSPDTAVKTNRLWSNKRCDTTRNRVSFALQKIWRFGTTDVNQTEWQAIQMLPPELRKYISRYTTTQNHAWLALIVERIRNADGSDARILGSYIKVEDDIFWKEFMELVALVEKFNLYKFFDIFSRYGTNILVQEWPDGWKCRPVDWNPPHFAHLVERTQFWKIHFEENVHDTLAMRRP